MNGIENVDLCTEVLCVIDNKSVLAVLDVIVSVCFKDDFDDIYNFTRFLDFIIIFLKSSISRYPHENLTSKMLAYYDFTLASCVQYRVACAANAPLTSMLKILSDLKIKQTFGSSVQINKSLQLCFRIS